MDVSSASSFYDPPVKYDEGKTIELYEKLKTSFEDVEGLLVGIQTNLLKVQRESALTVMLIEKLKSVQTETAKDKNEGQNINQTRNKNRKSK